MFTKETVIDGGGLVTLDGGGTTRILYLDSDYNTPTPRLTVQRLTFHAGHGPPAGDDTAHGGGAIYRDGGSLTVIDSTFDDNHARRDRPGPRGRRDLRLRRRRDHDRRQHVHEQLGERRRRGRQPQRRPHDHQQHVHAATRRPAPAATRATAAAAARSTWTAATRRRRCAASRSRTTPPARSAAASSAYRTITPARSRWIARPSTATGHRRRPPATPAASTSRGSRSTITASTISRNQGVYNGGIWINTGTAKLTNVTIAENTATGSNGGGMWLAQHADRHDAQLHDREQPARPPSGRSPARSSATGSRS